MSNSKITHLLSEESLISRKPLSPELLIGALQDPIHIEVGRFRGVRLKRDSKKGSLKDSFT